MPGKNNGTPFIGIIHVEKDTDRYNRLLKELEQQGIKDYTIFPAVHDIRSVKRGINLAHKSVIEYAKEAGFEEVCVMEDDLRFTNPNSFNYFLKSKPTDYDLYLGGIYVGDIFPDKTVKSFSGFHLYLCHSRFYDKFLATEEDAHVDREMTGLGRFVVCEPFAAIQYNGFSSNTGKEEVYDHLLHGRRLYDGTLF